VANVRAQALAVPFLESVVGAGLAPPGVNQGTLTTGTRDYSTVFGTSLD